MFNQALVMAVWEAQTAADAPETTKVYGTDYEMSHADTPTGMVWYLRSRSRPGRLATWALIPATLTDAIARLR